MFSVRGGCFYGGFRFVGAPSAVLIVSVRSISGTLNFTGAIVLGCNIKP